MVSQKISHPLLLKLTLWPGTVNKSTTGYSTERNATEQKETTNPCDNNFIQNASHANDSSVTLADVFPLPSL